MNSSPSENGRPTRRRSSSPSPFQDRKDTRHQKDIPDRIVKRRETDYYYKRKEESWRSRSRSKDLKYGCGSNDSCGRSDRYWRSRSRPRDSYQKERVECSPSREAIYDTKDQDRYANGRRSRSRSHRQCRDSIDRGRRHLKSEESTRSRQDIGSYYCKNARDEVHDRLREGVKDSSTEGMEMESDACLKETGNEGENWEFLSDDEHKDVERIMEESRKRRQAILEKYSEKNRSCEEQKDHEGKDMIHDAAPIGHVNFAVDVELFDYNGNAPPVVSDDFKASSDLGKRVLLADASDRPGSKAKGLGERSPKSDKSTDMFSDDIFGESTCEGWKLVKTDSVTLGTSALTDNWDDGECYYRYRIGEVLDSRYEVAASHGKGVFSTVVRARDTKASTKEHEEVAIKMIRNNEFMFKSGQRELAILERLAEADPDNKCHCVRLLTSFEYRNHFCLVFESLYKNLREILKMFGRNIGIKLTAVQSYAKQLFVALKHLRNCGVLHCDIKPDNMLVNEAKSVLKLCDFGSAMLSGERETARYLVSRFYRAPEIILGLPYDHPLDMWSVGCCLYEFFTGKVLFPGLTNNDMVKLHMELKGPFPKKMLKRAAFASTHFDQDFNFCVVDEDPMTMTNTKRVLVNLKQRDIGTRLFGSVRVDEDAKMLRNFKDLLDKIFMLDPEKRLTVSEALGHPFITGK